MISILSDKVILQVMLVDTQAFSTCIVVKGSHFAAVPWVLLLAYETGGFLIQDVTTSDIVT